MTLLLIALNVCKREVFSNFDTTVIFIQFVLAVHLMFKLFELEIENFVGRFVRNHLEYTSIKMIKFH